VRIEAVGFHLGGPLANCNLDLHPNLAELTLTRPLAGRHLIHVPLSSGWGPVDANEVRAEARGLVTLPRSGHDGLIVVYRGKDPRTLLLEALETTRIRGSGCWETYDISVSYSPRGVAEIKSVARQRDPSRHCAAVNVGSFYSRLSLHRTYRHHFVIDGYTGKHVPIVAVIHPTKDEIIN
jgi:hypothetical protein